jgi:hypothetical protein
MDSVIQIIHEAMPFFYVLAALAIIAKIVLVFSNKGFDLPALIISFFRLYGESEKKMTTNKRRINYMNFNNYINIYLYSFLLLFVIMLLIFQKDIFTYESVIW